MPIEIGDSTATVRSKINAVLTDAGLNPADNVDTTAATTLLNEAAGLWDVDVEFVDRMPEMEFRDAFTLLEGGGNPLFNFKAGNTVNLRQSLVDADAGSPQHPCWIFPGDSVTRGVAHSLWSSSWVEVMSSELASRLGIRTNTDAEFGIFNGYTGAQMETFDPRLDVGAGIDALGAQSLGGLFWRNLAGSAPLAFTPINAYDTVEVVSKMGNGFGTIGFDIAGGTVTQRNLGAGGAAYVKNTLTGSEAVQAFNTTRVSGNVYWNGASTYKSTESQLRLLNVGCGGARSDVWLSNFGLGGALLYSPKASFFCIGINNWLQAASVVTFKSDVTASVISQKAASCDPVLVVPPATGSVEADAAAQAPYVAALYEVAVEQDLPLIDLQKKFGSFAAVDARGWMYADKIHPNTLYDAAAGAFMAETVAALVA